ncbi:hypothetical protein ACP4OV_016642 [Aristida adscensionis]
MEAALLVLMGVTLTTILFFHLLLLRWKNRRSRQFATPPGSMGLPLLGETLQFIARSSSLGLRPFFKRRLERYGPIFKTNLLGENMIVSVDPELNNYVFEQEEKAFQMWMPASLSRIMGDDSILRSSGYLHKHTRNLILRLIGYDNLRLLLLHDMQRVVQTSLASWIERPSIELTAAITMMTFGAFANRLVGCEASNISGELWKHFEAIRRGLRAIPLNIPGTAYYKSLQARKNAIKILKRLFYARMKGERRETMDFLDMLIRELKKENPVLTENYALNVLFGLLFFSSDTIATAVTAAIKFLSDSPEALQELTEEHQQIRSSRDDPDSEITWEEYKSMKFTSHVIHESQRLADVIPVLFRKANKDVHIKGYTIPEGWIMMICLGATHFNPTTYEDPTKFNPWRWKNISEPVRGSKDFVGFGSGLRFCVGADLAKLQMAVFLHFLVTKYRWKLISGGNMVFAPSLGFPEGFQIHLASKT